MKIKYTKVTTIGKTYVWLTLWLMLPDVHTFWSRLGESDKDFLERCWNKKLWSEIDRFMEGYRLSLCRGSIKFGARGEAAHKKFSWTWFRVRIYGTWTELNTPYPKPRSPNKQFREVPISRTTHFLSLLRIPTYIPIYTLKDYITLYILKRDYGKNILEGYIRR